jgi:hypothetical protein
MISKIGIQPRPGGSGLFWFSSVMVCPAALLCLSAGGARADQESASAYEIKAAFLYNFALHVEWPASAFDTPNSEILIAVLGEDPFKGFLDNAVKDKTAQGRSLKVLHPAKPGELAKCHILFVPDGEKEHMTKVREFVKDGPILVVGESEKLLEQGVVMNFFIEEKRVRFALSLKAAKKQNLKIGSKLQKIARVVD